MVRLFRPRNATPGLRGRPCRIEPQKVRLDPPNLHNSVSQRVCGPLGMEKSELTPMRLADVGFCPPTVHEVNFSVEKDTHASKKYGMVSRAWKAYFPHLNQLWSTNRYVPVHHPFTFYLPTTPGPRCLPVSVPITRAWTARRLSSDRGDGDHVVASLATWRG